MADQQPMQPAEVVVPAPDTVRVELLFTGDVMQHEPQVAAARMADGFDYAPTFAMVRPYFEQADFTIVNLETTLSDRPPYTGYPLFRSPHVLASTLRDVGVDVVCQANNHCLDGGSVGVRRTTATLDACGLLRTGVFRDSVDYRRNRFLYLRKHGIRFLLLNYTYGTNGLPTPPGMWVNRIDTVLIARDLAEAAEVDCRMVALHWGNEYERTPNREQCRLAAFLRRHGVDLVIGHHPHVIQPFEADSSGVVFYSLGNFVSNQRQRFRDGGLMGRVVVERIGEGPLRYQAEVIPVWVDKAHRYRVVPPAAADTLSLGAAYQQFMVDTRQLLQKGV